MHPILSDVRKTLGYGLLWLLAGVGLAAWLRPGSALVQILPFTLPLCFVTGFGLLSAHHVSRALPYSQRRPLRVALLFGTAALVSGALVALLAKAWDALLRLLSSPAASDGAAWPFFLGAALLYLLSLLVHEILFAFENVRAATERAAEMRAQAREAELQMLRTQVNPHFLFNCLNSISALTTLDPAAARAMTLDLAEFFRSTLALSMRQRIRLDEEIDLCRHFLAIEQRRFGERLSYALQVDTAAGRCLVPPMCLQPLLENALKHGSGVIRIAAAVRGPWLHLTVDNPLQPERRSRQGSGIGLRNLEQRLALLYGARARLRWERQPLCFCVEMTIPYTDGADDDGD